MTARTFELFTDQHDAGDLVVARLRGTEALSKPYQFDLLVIARDPELEGELLGQRATLVLRNAESERLLHGVVARAAATARFRDAPGHALRLRLVPLLWTLGGNRRSRIFQQLSVPDIVEDVLGAAGLPTRWALGRDHAPRPYCVQYQESDLAFVQRILAEEGIFWFVEPAEAEDRIVFGDAAASYAPLAGKTAVPFRPGRASASGEHLSRLAWSRRLRPHALLRTAFDVRRPHVDLRGRAEVKAQGPRVEVHAHDLPWDAARTSDAAAATELEQLRRGADQIEAEGMLLRAAPGARFRVEDPPSESLGVELAIVSVEHEGWQPVDGVAPPSPAGEDTPSHAASLRCVPAGRAHRPARPTRPVAQILETATVVGPPGEEIHTDELGRIKIRFPWDVEGPGDDRGSCWVRTTQGWSGASFGVVQVPRVGMGVIVGFLAGDPDRPVVLGTAYDGTHAPPFDLPADKTKSGLRTCSSPGGGGYNELSFEDASGRERVLLRAERDLETHVGHDEARTVARDQRVHVGGDRHVEVEGDGVHVARGNQVVTIEKNLVLHVVGRQHIVIDGLGEGATITSPGAPEPSAADSPSADVLADASGVARREEPGPPAPGALTAGDLSAKTARLSVLVEHLPDELYDAGEALRVQATSVKEVALGLLEESHVLLDRYAAVLQEERAAMIEQAGALRRQAELVATTARGAAEHLRRQADVARASLAGAEEAAKALHAAMIEHLADASAVAEGAGRSAAMVSQMAGTIVESAGQVVPALPRASGSESGGGGGDNAFTADGKGSKMTIKGGGTIEAPDGLTISSGASSIKIAPSGIVISGPIVEVVGHPIKLNC